MAKLTAQDRVILRALNHFPDGSRSYGIAEEGCIHTSSPSETAARHLIKLTGLGLAMQVGTRMFPMWRITDAGRAALEASNG